MTKQYTMDLDWMVEVLARSDALYQIIETSSPDSPEYKNAASEYDKTQADTRNRLFELALAEFYRQQPELAAATTR